MPAYRPLSERFAEKYRVNAANGCWEWTGSTITGGYGMIKGERGEGQTNVLAHRVSYELNVGPVPDGLFVLHKCDTPACVNPDHLFLGNHPGNMKDMERKGRARRLSAGEVRTIIDLLSRGYPQTFLAEFYDINRATLQRALSHAATGDYGPEKPRAGPEARYTRIREADRADILLRLKKGASVAETARHFNCDRRTVRNIRDRA